MQGKRIFLVPKRKKMGKMESTKRKIFKAKFIVEEISNLKNYRRFPDIKLRSFGNSFVRKLKK